jgi:chemotaxis protein CheD
MMIEAMERLGGKRDRVIAKMAGGAQLFKHMTMDMLRIGYRNVEAISSILDDFGIRLVSKDIGGDQGRTVYFFTSDGRMLVRYSRGGELWI